MYLSYQALTAADKVFGSTINKGGFKTIKGCGVIQGDGIDLKVRLVAVGIDALSMLTPE